MATGAAAASISVWNCGVAILRVPNLHITAVTTTTAATAATATTSSTIRATTTQVITASINSSLSMPLFVATSTSRNPITVTSPHTMLLLLLLLLLLLQC